jgi:tetratricopeptide (TPR) repeat protein
MLKQKLIVGLLVINCCLVFSCKKTNNEGTFIPPLPNELEYNKFKATLAILSDEIQSNSSNHENYYKRAKIYFQLNDIASAKNDIDEALDLYQNDGRYRLLNSQILKEQGNTKIALEQAKLAEILGQKTPELYTTIGDLYLKTNQIVEAKKYLKFALDYAPYNGESYYYNALLKVKLGDTTTALQYYNLAKQYKPKFANTYKRLSEIYNNQGNTDLAKEITFELAKQYPNDAENCSIIARIYQRKMIIDSALIFYKKAIELKPNMYQASYDAGMMSLRNRYFDDAIMFFTNTYKYAPKTPFINTSLAMCYENKGDKIKALELYTLGFRLNNTDFKAIEGIKRLEPKPYYDENYYLSTQKNDQKSVDKKIKIDTNRIRLTEIKPKKVIIQKRDSSINKIQIPNKFPLPIIK